MPNKVSTMGQSIKCRLNSIDIGKGINVMRGHVDANGLISASRGTS